MNDEQELLYRVAALSIMLLGKLEQLGVPLGKELLAEAHEVIQLTDKVTDAAVEAQKAALVAGFMGAVKQ